MNYATLKSKVQAFVAAHHAYCWGVLEFSMLCAAAYSVFGLILLATGALAASTIIMMLEFMIAPVYAAVLFVSVTAALSVIFTLPYAIALGLHLPRRPVPVAAMATAAPKKRRKTAARPRRTAKA